MYFDYLVQIPENTGRITFHSRGGSTYVEYTYDRRYISEKRYSIPKRTTIGKVYTSDPTKMYPNPNFVKYFPDKAASKGKDSRRRGSCLRLGTYLVIKKVIRNYDLDIILKRVLGNDGALLLDLAIYAIVTEDNGRKYFPGYAHEHPLFMPATGETWDSGAFRLLRDITHAQVTRFLDSWNAVHDKRKKVYIFCNSSYENQEAGDLEIAPSWQPSDKTDRPTFDYALACYRNKNEPLFYEEYPAGCADSVQLRIMLNRAKEYGYSSTGIIMDNGRLSRDNLHLLDDGGHDFILMLKGTKSPAKELISSNRGNLNDALLFSGRHRIQCATVEGQLFPSDERRRYFHLYYSSERRDLEQKALAARIARMKRNLEKVCGVAPEIDQNCRRYFTPVYNHENQEDQLLMQALEKQDVIEEENDFCGYFCIVTSRKMNPQTALELYKSRDDTEKLFNPDKRFFMHEERHIPADQTAEAKAFIAFIAYIIRNSIYAALKEANIRDENNVGYISVPAAVDELEAIELVRQGNGEYWLVRGLTPTQEAILAAFGLTMEDVKKEAKNISSTSTVESTQTTAADGSRPKTA